MKTFRNQGSVVWFSGLAGALVKRLTSGASHDPVTMKLWLAASSTGGFVEATNYFYQRYKATGA